MVRRLIRAAAGSAVLALVLVTGSPGPVGADGVKMTICHVPPGNPDNAHVIRVGIRAVPAHLMHGDRLGNCGSDPI